MSCLGRSGRITVQILLLAALGITGCRTSAPEVARYAFSRGKMGTEFRIVLFSPDSSFAAAAAAEAFERIDELNERLSDYLPQSELNRLSETAGLDTLVHVSEDVWRVLATSVEVAEVTGGAFDPTVGRLTRLWRRAIRRNALPRPDEIENALRTVGYGHLTLDANHRAIALNLPGTRLDLGGIAKGYAADEALAVLRRRGLRSSLVDAGGDVALGDPPPGASGWRIAIPGVDSTGYMITEIVLAARCAIATSGDTYRYLTVDSVRYSHILDPATGLGVTHHRIVTVVSPTGMLADALASALSVLDPQALDNLTLPFDETAWRILEPAGDGASLRQTPSWPLHPVETRTATWQRD